MYKSILVAVAVAGFVPIAGRAADSTPSQPAADTAALSDTAAMLNEVIQIATAGQTPETQAEVRKFVQDNQGPIAAVINESVKYISQLQTPNQGTPPVTSGSAIPATADGAPATPPQSQASPQTASANPMQPSQTSAMQPSSGIQPLTMQPSGGLQTSSVQPSGGLQTGHLRGYPSLPDVDPVSSVKSLTPEQADYVQKTNADDMARKRALMAQSALMGN